MADAMRIDGELEGVGPFGAEVAPADGAIGIAFNVDDLAALAEDELPAADGAVRTNALSDSGAAQPRSLDRKSTRLNSSHSTLSRMPSSA